MRPKFVLFISLITLLFSNCSDDENDTTNPEFVELTFDFQNDIQSWGGRLCRLPCW